MGEADITNDVVRSPASEAILLEVRRRSSARGFVSTDRQLYCLKHPERLPKRRPCQSIRCRQPLKQASGRQEQKNVLDYCDVENPYEKLLARKSLNKFQFLARLREPGTSYSNITERNLIRLLCKCFNVSSSHPLPQSSFVNRPLLLC